jgi:TonB family protein
MVMSLLPKKVYQAVLPDRLADDIVWLTQPGPGGGGGGGNKMPDPPKKAELKGEQKISVPTPPEPKPDPPKVEPPPEQLNIPAQTLAAAPVNSPGALSPNPNDTASTGSGSGSGAGPGQGSGLGPGFGGGTGGGAYRPGNGVNLPQPLKEVKPQYTADAMRAKVQGTVLLECVVLPDGSVGSVEVVRSLDSTFGLDQEAIKAAKQWRFRPRHALRRAGRGTRHDRADLHPPLGFPLYQRAEARMAPDSFAYTAVFRPKHRDDCHSVNDAGAWDVVAGVSIAGSRRPPRVGG